MAYGPNHLGDFFDAMLRLRGQRLQEQEIGARQSAAMWSSIGGAIGNIGQSFGAAMQQRGQDDVANALMNEQANIPRAQSVDRSAQGPADARAARMPGFRTGGVAELGMRNQMSDMQRQDMRMILADMAEKRQQDMLGIAKARASYQNSTQPMKDAYSDSMSYYDNMTEHQKAISKALETGDQNLYDASVQSINGLYTAAKSRKLDVPAPIIAPWQSPAEKQALQGARMELEDEQEKLNSMRGSWIQPDDTIFKMPGIGGPLKKEYDARRAEQEQKVGDLESKISSAGRSSAAPSASPGAATGSKPMATQAGGGGGFSSPDQVKQAYQAGQISKGQAAQILREQFGYQ